MPALTAQNVVGSFSTVTAAGTNQGTATLLSAAVNAVSAAGSADGVVLPTAAQGSQVGDDFWILCTSSTTAKVYPGGSDTINGSASAVSVAQNKMLILKRFTPTAWGAIVTA